MSNKKIPKKELLIGLSESAELLKFLQNFDEMIPTLKQMSRTELLLTAHTQMLLLDRFGATRLVKQLDAIYENKEDLSAKQIRKKIKMMRKEMSVDFFAAVTKMLKIAAENI